MVTNMYYYTKMELFALCIANGLDLCLQMYHGAVGTGRWSDHTSTW